MNCKSHKHLNSKRAKSQHKTKNNSQKNLLKYFGHVKKADNMKRLIVEDNVYGKRPN